MKTCVLRRDSFFAAKVMDHYMNKGKMVNYDTVFTYTVSMGKAEVKSGDNISLVMSYDSFDVIFVPTHLKVEEVV